MCINRAHIWSQTQEHVPPSNVYSVNTSKYYNDTPSRHVFQSLASVEEYFFCFLTWIAVASAGLAHVDPEDEGALELPPGPGIDPVVAPAEGEEASILREVSQKTELSAVEFDLKVKVTILKHHFKNIMASGMPTKELMEKY